MVAVLRRTGAIGLLVGLLLGLVAILATPAPAGAAITAVNPQSADVDPGGTTTATVRVSAGGLTCISVSTPRGDASADPNCTPADSDGRNWSSLLTVHAPNEPGQYTVTIHDDSFGGQDGKFTVRVRTPPPPPSTTTTTTPAATTTTAPSTTTTGPTTTPSSTTSTTAAPTTTSSTSTTTTLPKGAPGDPFQSVVAMLDQALPAEGIFLPLTGRDFRTCLPLNAPCSDDGSGLALVPAATAELLWTPLADGSAAPPPFDLRDVPPIPAVGVGPASPDGQQYDVTMLDLTTPQPTLRTLVRTLDANGDLVAATGDGTRPEPSVQGPVTSVRSGSGLAPSPFGRPTLVKGSSFTEAAPVIPMYASSTPSVVYGLRADPRWGLNVEFVPLFGESLPFLARRVDGPPGLFFAAPTGLKLPEAAKPKPVTATPTADDDGSPPLALISLAVILLGLVIVAGALVRRRRRHGPRSAPANVDDSFGDDIFLAED
jgi:hypothetical protein